MARWLILSACGLTTIFFPIHAMAVIHDVSIVDFSFQPSNLAIAAGDTVRWTNHGGFLHSSTSNSGIWDSGILENGDSYMRGFPTSGPYSYHCSVHPSMTALVSVSATSADEDNPSAPDRFRLEPNFPNPFNSATSISFDLGSPGRVRLEIFDTVGRKLETLIDGQFGAGRHSVTWDAGERPSGIYFYRVEFDGKAKMGRMTLLK